MPESTFDHNKKPIEPSAQAEAGEQEKASPQHPLSELQRQVGNRAVQQLIQRSGGEGAFELDDETSGRIDGARGGGQSLEGHTQEHMSAAMGYDFSDVNVHTSQEADDLNHQVGAEAFTTGKDIFFREGAYDPGSQGGQELIAHELTHVVQQGTGKTGGGGGGMTVNAPGDSHEQEADAVAQSVTGPAAQPAVQMHESESALQMQEDPEDEMQLQELPEDEMQLQEDPEDEMQLQEMPEEEEEFAQRQPIEEEEEMLQPKRIGGHGSPRIGG